MIKQKPIVSFNYKSEGLNFGIYEPEIGVFSMAVFRQGRQVTCTCSNPNDPDYLDRSSVTTSLLVRIKGFEVWEQDHTFFLVLNGKVLGQTGIPNDVKIMACDGSHQSFECEAGLHIPVQSDEEKITITSELNYSDYCDTQHAPPPSSPPDLPKEGEEDHLC